MDIFRPLADTPFIPYNVGGYDVLAPQFLVEKHPRSSWEVARFQSMERELKPGMVLVDVGAEQGYMSAIYARFVGGGEHMVLVEPVPQAWPNIKATWAANGLADPLACWCGFASDHVETATYHDFPTGYRGVWPECAFGSDLLDATKFRYLHEHGHCTDSITVDELCERHGIRPSGISVDVEGFEPLVVLGAINTIRACSPLVWLSLHGGGAHGNNIYDQWTGTDHTDALRRLMADLEYRETVLAEDHELHTFWRPR